MCVVLLSLFLLLVAQAESVGGEGAATEPALRGRQEAVKMSAPP